MNLPTTKHYAIKYRDGESGLLLTTTRKNFFPVMTIRDKDGVIIYHFKDGRYIAGKEGHFLDIVEINEEG